MAIAGQAIGAIEWESVPDERLHLSAGANSETEVRMDFYIRVAIVLWSSVPRVLRLAVADEALHARPCGGRHDARSSERRTAGSNRDHCRGEDWLSRS
jgi:hypothetical protein